MSSLKDAIKTESEKFEELYTWLEGNMPSACFEEIDENALRRITHVLTEFDSLGFFARLHFRNRAFVLCLDSSDADMRILKEFQMEGIKSYRTFVSKTPPPFKKAKSPLRLASIFTSEEMTEQEKKIPKVQKDVLFELVKGRNKTLTRKVFDQLADAISPLFLRSVSQDRLVIALDLFAGAEQTDLCQYDVRYNKEWEKNHLPSTQIVLVWKNLPKHTLFYRLAKTLYHHNLVMQQLHAIDIDPYSKENYVVMALDLHGMNGKAAREETNMDDFIRELITLKYFGELERVETVFVDSRLASGNAGNLIKTIIHFVHQTLACENSYLYSFVNIEEGICRHPELIVKLVEAFEQKFHPKNHDTQLYASSKEKYATLVDQIDTGNRENDSRRKNILKTALLFIDYTLKTNFYCSDKTALSFRLDPAFLDHLPFDRKEKFPHLPYAIFFIKGMHYIGFHIRFKDLSRGGLRTVIPSRMEQFLTERNSTFVECYNLALTQQKKNKDIPEGGAKAIILMDPYELFRPEEEIYRKELQILELDAGEIEKRILAFRKIRQPEYLYETQRSFIASFLTLVNCNEDGSLRSKTIVDYYQKPEYIYLGPDENLHNEMIEWISNYSISQHYKPMSCFITSKPGAGINHKEYGVTSLGVNTYMIEVLKYLGIDPYTTPFTVKISGGPDGDVAGNQILNLYTHFPKTAKLLALIDVSGTIHDPKGLDLKALSQLFEQQKPIRYYPPEKLSPGGFLLDLFTKREPSPYVQQTLCYRMGKKELSQEWLSGNETNHLLKTNVHQTATDVFIPCGGRPKTLQSANIKDFLNQDGKPTSKAIIEGANLYLSPRAREQLEALGVLIVKDSSANKGGVICSSFEVLTGLVLSEKEFMQHKETFMKQILAIIRARALDEATLLLQTHAKTHENLTGLSDQISKKINTYTYEILDYLRDRPLSNHPKDPLIQCLLDYCPPFLKDHYPERILTNIPDIHKKAIIACYIASRLIYSKGVKWSPSVIDILPLIPKILFSTS